MPSARRARTPRAGICDGVSDRERAAGRQILVLVGGNHPERGVGETAAAGQTVATFPPSRMGIEIGWWAPNPGRPRGGVEGYTEGHGTPAGADFRYLLEQLGAEGWRSAFASPIGWKDGVCGTVMRKPLLIPFVALSPIKPGRREPANEHPQTRRSLHGVAEYRRPWRSNV
jgi:hypothetical protein